MTTQPKESREGLLPQMICTAATPYKPGLAKGWVHPDAVPEDQRDGYPGGDIVTYRCPHCDLGFDKELPQ